MSALADKLGPMKVVRLVVENVKRVQMVELKPKDPVVIISGANGSGKSSLIDAIEYAMAGERSIPTSPIRNGEDAARIVLDLGDIIVTREFLRSPDYENGEEKTRLTVRTPKGADYSSPQKLLTEIWSKLGIDPSDFYEKASREQLEVLRTLVTLDVDLDAMKLEETRLFDTRTGVGRDLKQLEARVAAFLIGPDWPTERVEYAAVLEEIRKANDHNQRVEMQRVAVERDRREADRLAAAAESMREQAAELLRRAELADQAARGHREAADVQLPATMDTAPLQAKLDEIEAINDKVRQRDEFNKLESDRAAKEAEHDGLTARIDKLRADRARAIANAKYPVPGLAFGDGEVMFNSLPLEQASDAERWRVAFAIAMAQNPKVRLVIIKNGSLLDTKSRAIVRALAEEHGYQVFMECVSERDAAGNPPAGVYLEEGIVVHTDETADALL